MRFGVKRNINTNYLSKDVACNNIGIIKISQCVKDYWNTKQNCDKRNRNIINVLYCNNIITKNKSQAKSLLR